MDFGGDKMEQISEGDQKKLDAITEAFIKALISNKMDNEWSYLELYRRILKLTTLEICWKFTHEEERRMAQAWGPTLN